MSSAENKSLEVWVREWADGNDDAYNYWMNELSGPPHFITSIQALEKVAKSPDWEEFLQAFKPPLRTYMRELGGKYKSKFLVIMSWLSL
jgi:hypothetical protein